MSPEERDYGEFPGLFILEAPSSKGLKKVAAHTAKRGEKLLDVGSFLFAQQALRRAPNYDECNMLVNGVLVPYDSTNFENNGNLRKILEERLSESGRKLPYEFRATIYSGGESPGEVEVVLPEKSSIARRVVKRVDALERAGYQVRKILYPIEALDAVGSTRNA